MQTGADAILDISRGAFRQLVMELTGSDPGSKDEITSPVSPGLDLLILLEKSGSIALHSIVFEDRSGLPEGLPNALLEANYGCGGTAGATLGAIPSRGLVLLSRILDHAGEFPPECLLEDVARFTETARFWQERLISGEWRSGGDDGSGWDKSPVSPSPMLRV